MSAFLMLDTILIPKVPKRRHVIWLKISRNSAYDQLALRSKHHGRTWQSKVFSFMAARKQSREFWQREKDW